MTSLRQTEANRRNALKSTGPRTLEGKRASRRNALRHGFTAQTVIEPLEDPAEYEARGRHSYGIRSANAGSSADWHGLFWRLRRAGSIETGLFRMQGEIVRAFRRSREKPNGLLGQGTGVAEPELGQELTHVDWVEEPIRGSTRIQRAPAKLPSLTCGWQTSTTNLSIG
jgi:hypothetical protein